MENLKKEIGDVSMDTPKLSEVLLSMTRLIEPPAWIASSWEWKDGQVFFQVQETKQDLELASKLESSPVLGDVRETGSTFNGRENVHIVKFQLNARYDTPEEKERMEAMAAEKARKAAEERAAEKTRAQEAGQSPASTTLEDDVDGDDAEVGAQLPLENGVYGDIDEEPAPIGEPQVNPPPPPVVPAGVKK
jgi:hypothetical protein